LGAQMAGPARICEGATAQFSGSTLLPGQPAWKWIFHDGTTVAQQNPPAKKYPEPGLFPVKLVVDNGGCADTLVKTLQVDAKPIVGIPFKQYTLCKGARVTITATGGSSYAWSPGTGLDNTNTAAITANPVINTTYKVTATSSTGCSNSDSLSITVVQPFDVQVGEVKPICAQSSVALLASGAHSYQWIQNTAGLNDSAIAAPVAQPLVTTIYTVVGTDANKCFTDTARVTVTVMPLPTVDAGQSTVLMTGTTHQLQPVFSTDVVQWAWSPASYLSCATCSAPVASPPAPVNYKLTVTTAAGCSAADTVSINLLCSESRVFIPAAFTPNNDGTNDLFAIKGDGIRIVHHFVIYDRYGHPLFERSNFSLQDARAAWDGLYKGVPVPAGSYVYIAEMSCNEKTFTRRGSVMVVR
ncbi:MAG: gliding motility-associated C-terminal domain-containing protein, partial [Bacteroidota bacterium]